MSWNPLLLVGAVIGVITALLIAAYVGVKDKKTSMGFERNMDDGEILRRLAGYARQIFRIAFPRKLEFSLFPCKLSLS